MGAPEFPFSVRVVKPLTVMTEEETVMEICAGTVLDVLSIDPADPSVGIYNNQVVFVDPSDIGFEVYANGVEWPSQEIGDDGELIAVTGDVEPFPS